MNIQSSYRSVVRMATCFALLLLIMGLLVQPLPAGAQSGLRQQMANPAVVHAPLSSISFTSTHYTAYEAKGKALMYVTINPPSDQHLRVQLTTYQDSAQAGSDYVAQAFQEHNIPANVGLYELQVEVINSRAEHEPNEQFLVRLSNPTEGRGQFGQITTATVTIVDEVCTQTEPANDFGETPDVYRYFGLPCKRSFKDEAVGASDFYEFTIKNQRTMKLELYNTSEPRGGDYDMYLYSTSTSPPSLIAQSNQYGTTAEHILQVLAPGRYLVRLYWYSSLAGSDPRYTLKIFPR